VHDEDLLLSLLLASSLSTPSASAINPAQSILSPSPPTSGGQFPNASEQDLIARLPTALSSEECFRADPDEIPRNYPFHGGPLEPLPVSAAVRCPLSAGLEVFFYAAAACNLVSACGADTEATIFSLAARREVQRGTCEAGVAALDRWQFGRAQGWVLCGEDMLWTYDQTNLLGRVRGPDASTTFQWWHENARFPAE